MAPNSLNSDEFDQLHKDVLALKEQVKSLGHPGASTSGTIHILTLLAVVIGLFFLIAMERHTKAVQQYAQDIVTNLEIYADQSP